MSATRSNEPVNPGKSALFKEERLFTLRANVLFPFCIRHLKTLPASAKHMCFNDCTGRGSCKETDGYEILN